MFALLTRFLLVLRSIIEARASRGAENPVLSPTAADPKPQVAGATPTFISERLHEAHKFMTTLTPYSAGDLSLKKQIGNEGRETRARDAGGLMACAIRGLDSRF